ncbi:beta-galactosidase/beta-glucuronidase [Histoplasma capsulatum]|uniref:Beta-galactosidase/beta-glucuronidase n=1 Tax=Ajellomyces capsulatus TaxID=5037 RepID=A0A8A1M1B2_AJECA|nr:beta-galactosidase/beta-glucuronidase [Histoplasma capsulatum]
MASSVQEYPRPDFVRSDLNWKSLNGPWSFLYDDDDSGILDGWHLRGLPEQIALQISIGGVIVDKTSQISIPQFSNVADCAVRAKLSREQLEDINRRAKKLYLESVDPKGLK